MVSPVNDGALDLLPTSQGVHLPVNDRVLERKLRARSARIAVVGLGFAGLPMAVEFARSGYLTIGLDVDQPKVDLVCAGRSPVSNVTDDEIASLRTEDRLAASTDRPILDKADVAVICAPTPLT